MYIENNDTQNSMNRALRNTPLKLYDRIRATHDFIVKRLLQTVDVKNYFLGRQTAHINAVTVKLFNWNCPYYIRTD